jgi:hypothetical protein
MSFAQSELDEQIARLRKGDTLAENQVKALCEKVRFRKERPLDVGKQFFQSDIEEWPT